MTPCSNGASHTGGEGGGGEGGGEGQVPEPQLEL